MLIIVHFDKTYALSFNSSPTLSQIKLELSSLAKQNIHDINHISLSYNDEILTNSNQIVESEEAVVILRGKFSFNILGGKGGFGAQLRSLAKQKGLKTTTDFGACRDLNGRRLRHVNNEILLSKWNEAKSKESAFDVEMDTASGIPLWYVGIPSWSDRIKVDKRKKFLQPRLKTTICLDWVRAREKRNPPEGAPNYWGCPRGARCEYAHGEEELRGEKKENMITAKRDEMKDQYQQQREDYLAALMKSSKKEEEISELVKAGLAAAAKKSKPMKEDKEEVKSNDSKLIEVVGLNEKALKGDEHKIIDQPVANDDHSHHWIQQLTGVVNTKQIHSLKMDPNPVIVSEEGSYCIQIDGKSGFPTCLISPKSDDPYLIHEGNWCYELELKTNGLLQIGWVCKGFSPNNDSGDGVGDDIYSWSYDGFRNKLWHNGKESNYFDPLQSDGFDVWQKGDVVTSCISIERVEDEKIVRVSIGYAINGINYKKGFELKAKESELRGFCPAVSLEEDESCVVNVGLTPFRFSSIVDETQLNTTESSLKKRFPSGESKAIHSDSQSGKEVVIVSNSKEIIYQSIQAFSASNSSKVRVDATKELHTTSLVEGLVQPLDVAVPPQPTEVKEHVPINLESDEFNSIEVLESIGLENLKRELDIRGMKVSGTLHERAERLYAVRGISIELIDKKYKANKKGMK